jgi:hypothetical protein
MTWFVFHEQLIEVPDGLVQPDTVTHDGGLVLRATCTVQPVIEPDCPVVWAAIVWVPLIEPALLACGPSIVTAMLLAAKARSTANGANTNPAASATTAALVLRRISAP